MTKATFGNLRHHDSRAIIGEDAKLRLWYIMLPGLIPCLVERVMVYMSTKWFCRTVRLLIPLRTTPNLAAERKACLKQ